MRGSLRGKEERASGLSVSPRQRSSRPGSYPDSGGGNEAAGVRGTKAVQGAASEPVGCNEQ